MKSNEIVGATWPLVQSAKNCRSAHFYTLYSRCTGAVVQYTAALPGCTMSAFKTLTVDDDVDCLTKQCDTSSLTWRSCIRRCRSPRVEQSPVLTSCDRPSLLTASRENWRHSYIMQLSFLNISVTVFIFMPSCALVVPLGHLRRPNLDFCWLIDWLINWFDSDPIPTRLMKDTVLGLLAPLITELCNESLSSFYMVCLFRCLSNRHS